MLFGWEEERLMEKAVVLPSCQTLFILNIFLILFGFSVFEVQDILFIFYIKKWKIEHTYRREYKMHAQLNK